MPSARAQSMRLRLAAMAAAALLALACGIAAPAWAADESAKPSGDGAAAASGSADAAPEAVAGLSGAAADEVADLQPLAGYELAWTGGTGRLAGMACTALEQRDGTWWATLALASGNYPSMRVMGSQYESEASASDVSVFTVPLEPGVPRRVEALTTAMSQPHWIAYDLCLAPTGGQPSAEALLASYEHLAQARDGLARAQTSAVAQIVLMGGSAGDAAAAASYEPRAETSLEGVATALDAAAPAIAGLQYETSLDLQYADRFAVHYYEGGYKVVDIVDGATFLVVPEGATAPAGLPDGMAVLQQPLDRIYLCATSAMALFDAIGGMGAVTLTGTDVFGWEIDAPKRALQSGDMRYAGKYSAPDYEMLLAQGCDLAVESTMILHNPEVQEMIEQLGIAVLVERSSYETEPLGRTEWVKLYGALLNREAEAEAYFADQVATVQALDVSAATGKTVVFFAINSDGSVVIRRPDDYIARCIELGGGTYAFADLDVVGSSNTVDISMERFYAVASKADYLVYNGTIQNPIGSVADLVALSDTFENFKAVKEGNVWSCGRDLFQSTHKMAQLIRDFNLLVTEGDPADMTFLYRVG